MFDLTRALKAHTPGGSSRSAPYDKELVFSRRRSLRLGHRSHRQRGEEQRAQRKDLQLPHQRTQPLRRQAHAAPIALILEHFAPFTMPFLDLQSNLPASSFSEDFLKKFVSVTALALGKPEERIHLVVHPGLPLMIKNSSSPGVVLSVSAIGATDSAEKNKEHSAKIFNFLTSELNLCEDRIGIMFYALQPHQVGKRGTVMSFL